MSNFSQWWVGFSDSDKVKQFTWVCGTEKVLIDEVVSLIKDRISPQPWDLIHLDASETDPGALWSDLLQYPISNTPRLVVIREADALDPARVSDLLRKRKLSPDTNVILISSLDKIPREDSEGGKTVRPEHLRLFVGRGDVVECGPFTQATAKHAVSWVRSLCPMRIGVAAHLLERANGDLRLTRDLCRKLKILGTEPTMAIVNDLLREHPRDSFTNALLALDRKTALLSIESVPPEDFSRILGILDANVDLASLVHDMLVSYRPNSEILKAAGSRRFLVPDILPVAKNYNSSRVASIRRLLTDLDEVVRQGERTAVLETLVALW